MINLLRKLQHIKPKAAALCLTLVLVTFGTASASDDYRIITTDSEAQIALPRLVENFYKAYGIYPAWTDESSRQEMISAIKESTLEGLNPESYHLSEILRLNSETEGYSAVDDSSDFLRLDALLTDAYMTYCTHLLSGSISPHEVYGDWEFEDSSVDLIALLTEALDSEDVMTGIEQLIPKHPGYDLLKAAHQRYLDIQFDGGWPTIESGPMLRLGMRGKRVKNIRDRLKITGEMPKEKFTGNDYFFDYKLKQALIKFQSRHGLMPDGIVGDGTLAALNESAESKLRQIELNLERWRWLPRKFTDRYILVNITNFELDVFEQGYQVLNMRTVVGKPTWFTPEFSSRMSHITLNPSWNVPQSIAVKDLLPVLMNSPTYLSRNNFRVTFGSGENKVEIDHDGIDWTSFNEENLQLRFRQAPGAINALGTIKFIFPNPHLVYIHGTPSARDFREESRAFSHSCIRIEDPVKLAEYLLSGDPDWNRERILDEIANGDEMVVELPEPIDVHLIYWTSWVDSDGTVNFRPDVYGKDELLKEAMGSTTSIFQ